MKPARFNQIESLYHQALEIDETQRAAFLHEACGSDHDLRRNLEELLAEGPKAESFLEKAALREIAHEFAEAAGSPSSSWTGRRVGNYQFLSLLGIGGMGEVYQAHDTKLKRDVAIKILPGEASLDSDRVDRFQREAQVLASVNHPNIAAIYDLEEAAGSFFLVLELVEGETLAERLKGGPIPLDEGLQIAVQILDALAAAHERGIIHRDLKPANIKRTPEGKVKVLDFGLAKAFAVESVDPPPANSPTLMPSTTPGMILGTTAYMSPEQASGTAVDRRTDIFAFGAVLYEMLSGQPAFPGDTASAILAAVIRAEPDWQKLPASTPPGIRRLLRRCLQKDRNRRLQTAGDARIEIDEAANEPQLDADALSRVRSRGWLAWTTLALIGLIVVLAAVWPRSAPPPVPDASLATEARLELNTPPTTEPVSLAISPDGQKIVYVAGSEGQSLWVRPLDSVAQPLAGTDGATYPFWSPDSRSIGVFAQGKLKRINTVTGFVDTLATATAGRGGAWGPDGTIIFSASPSSPILRLPSGGGDPVAITQLELLGHGSHRYPRFFPDGRHFLYYAQGSSEGLYIGDLDSPERRFWLTASDSFGGSGWFSSGKLLFLRKGTLFAQDVDLARLALLGDPFLVAAPPPGGLQIRTVSASTNGRIAYRLAPSGGGPRQLAWFDRSGKEIERVRGLHYGIQPELSRDGRFVAMRTNQSGNTDITLLEIGGTTIPFTFDPKLDVSAVWSPDSRRIAFSSNRKGMYSIYSKLTRGAPGSEELLLETGRPVFPEDWSRDGRFILFGQGEKLGNGDLWVLPLEGDRKRFPVVQTDDDESYAQFSPDGKWVAYRSNESGQYEIYVQPVFDRMVGGKRQVSVNGGSFVQWGLDQKELFYIAPDNRLMVVPIRLDSDRLSVQYDAPVALFATRLGGAWQAPPVREYVFRDGRFLMNTALDEPVSPISVILNWKGKP
ncbi:MAG TPA: protein kinase [Terriglobia bacterium]|nr:protein kinase [Terriglobia bacterium]